MYPSQRLSLLTFPQFFSGTELGVNVVVLPRDQNPLNHAITAHATIPEAPPFADAELRFTASLFDDLGVFPHTLAPVRGIALPTVTPTGRRHLFEALASQLDITNLGTTNSDADLDALTFKPSAPSPRELTVKKYLPRSYRSAFHFTRPRHDNLVTNDSYHCAIRDGQADPGFRRDRDTVSWGKVFAHLLRQPYLAVAAGMIYETTFTVDPTHFPDGGWLYVDLDETSDYRTQLDADPQFVQRYAARIPPLTAGIPRQVFAAVQFPVRVKANPTDPDPDPKGNYDSLFVEAAAYDDGFARIVHCRQPINRDLLEEDSDGAYPVSDAGINLGWDDEEITDRYIRQMETDTQGDLSGRINAPIGVFGYAIDVRLPENDWESLNLVQSRQPLVLSNRQTPGDSVELGDFTGELPYQVFPVQVDGRKQMNYWLPMYFANWTGHSMVLPDGDAAEIYQHGTVTPEGLDGTGVSAPPANDLNRVYAPGPITAQLRYGEKYEFRVRMLDLSGGGPDWTAEPAEDTPSSTTSCRFKRYLRPNQPRIAADADTDLVNTDIPSPINELSIRRPKLGYPAVVFTGKYTDAVGRLTAEGGLAADPDSDAEHHEGLGIADPDIDRVEITVEVATLRLDKRDSVSGRDDYVHLYTTTRKFPTVHSDNDYEAELAVPVEYRDVRVLHVGGEADIATDLGLPGDIDDLDAIYLPTARTVRLTVRALAEDKADNGAYYGVVATGNRQLDVRYGEPVSQLAYRPSTDDSALLVQHQNVPPVQGVYLQPDLTTATDGRMTSVLLGPADTAQRDNVAALADRIKVSSRGLTLCGDKGTRVVFGCSSRIRHTLAPDGSSLTFASKGDLINHWIVAISFDVDRDWMWDALADRSFVVRRTMRFQRDATPVATDVEVGDVCFARTASFEALDHPDRRLTRVVFLDAVEPKKPADGGVEPDFPDTIEVSYTVAAQFKANHAQNHDAPVTRDLELPITTPPAQVPKIVSVGLALSPYERDDRNYSWTKPRRRHLWVEFAEPVRDPQDTYFARVLAVAPDQLLSHNDPELWRAAEEPVLSLDPEYIRVVVPGASNDQAGLSAMQPMTKSSTSDRHYLLPVPPGLHAEADEMFGFFTYEFRVGHFRDPAEDTVVWTTAQGRYGRRLRATGVQHPAPTLTCMTNRDDDKLWVTAPYAVAVHDGRNVTSDPPRTELWALLYAQVVQADGNDHRNILLDDRRLDWRVQVQDRPTTDFVATYTDEQREALRRIAFRTFRYELDAGLAAARLLKPADGEQKNKDGTRYGTCVWSQREIASLLAGLGLPVTSSLSVVIVEALPQITNIYEHIAGVDQRSKVAAVQRILGREQFDGVGRHLEQARMRSFVAEENRPSPVSDRLGYRRLLRTSPLTPVPATCPPGRP